MGELKFLRLSAVLQKTARKKSSLYADPEFPAPIHVGRSSFWVEAEIERWMNLKIAESRREPSLKAKLRQELQPRSAITATNGEVVHRDFDETGKHPDAGD